MSRDNRAGIFASYLGYFLIVLGAVLLALSRALIRVGPYSIGRPAGPAPGLYSTDVFSPYAAALVIALATAAIALERIEKRWRWTLLLSGIDVTIISIAIVWGQLPGSIVRSSETAIWVFDAALLGGCALLAVGAIIGLQHDGPTGLGPRDRGQPTHVADRRSRATQPRQ